ncbi:hypothetical protein MPMin1_gp04 [Microbacterium phage Min1]|uniref:Uncharacterized protein n=1 Tax=Microbacterium phage Min1 TaxID=446529 RepID=A6N1W2_9CAUD|nr:hypothetical protein MPMin1_gp04 [Microbacterium phage Min1]ABR10434.1 hypothetical protein [Microbacterium phage Min1]
MDDKQVDQLISETASAASYAAQTADAQQEILGRLDRIIELLESLEGFSALNMS